MLLKSGVRLGPYQLLDPLGEGGMGEVWKALDTRLSRTVAIKKAAARFSERFEREARSIAALNHPHICTLYDVGADYLVMEYIDGAPLKGPMSLDQALRAAIQLAGALDAAHRQGIVHRDLKPANILLTKSGIKVLDFGLATRDRARAVSVEESTTQSLTQEGAIVGTLQYMAPEQVQGKPTDARSDIFSFGCVLYELLTGKPAFDGSNAASVIAGIMTGEPSPLSSLRVAAPPALDQVLRRCLSKDPEERWQSARDLRAQLEWIAGSAHGMADSPKPGSRRIPWIAAAGLALAAVLGWAAFWRALRPPDRPLLRLSMDLGLAAQGAPGASVAISPDGRRLVFPSRGTDQKQRLATRLLDRSQEFVLPGTENGHDPFFSPDGEWVGFFANGTLKKVSVQGGSPVLLCEAPNGRGGSWGDDDNIVAALTPLSPLFRIPGSGGTPQRLTKLGSGDFTHRWPQVLPGSRAVLFTAAPSSSEAQEQANVKAIVLQTGATKLVQRGGYHARYVPSGYLLYVHGGLLHAVGFDPDRLQTRGAPRPLTEDVIGNPQSGGGRFDFSRNGTLVYVSGQLRAEARSMVWMDSSGKTEPLLQSDDVYFARLSPDGRRLALLKSGTRGIFVYDWQRDAMTRITFEGRSGVPLWSPDGGHIVFESGSGALWWIRSSGAGEPQRLLETSHDMVPWSFAPDGRLAYFELDPETGFDLYTLPLDLSDPDHPKAGTPQPFLRTPANEVAPVLSPAGRWIAYRSDESGNPEIYVQPFPGPGDKWRISSGGGLYAVWSRTSTELFYEAPDNRIMVVPYSESGTSFVPGKPRAWCQRQIFSLGLLNLDLAPDGKRFAVLAAAQDARQEGSPLRLMFLENLFDELRRRVPAGQ